MNKSVGEFNGGVITWDTVKRFLPDDNRFIIHILKRNGMYHHNNIEVIEECRFYLILAINNWIQKQFDFESEAHLVNFMSRTIVNGAKNTFKKYSSQKALVNRYSDSIDGKEVVVKGGEAGDYLGAIGVYNEQLCVEQDDVDLFVNYVERMLGYEYAEIIRLKMRGYIGKEIGEKVGLSTEVVYNRVKKVARLYGIFRRREQQVVNAHDIKQAEHRESNGVHRGLREERRVKLEREKKKQGEDFSEIRNFLLLTSDAQAKEEVFC